MATVFLASIVRYVSIKKLQKIATQLPLSLWSVVLEVVQRTKWLFIVIIALYAGALLLKMPDSAHELINSITVTAVLIQVGLWASAAMLVVIEQYRHQQLEKDPASVTTLNLLNFIGRVILWSLVLLLVLDNLNFNITALVTGLGVGGIAVALAMQTILGDLFASLSIVLDKPFVMGDFLVVDDLLGTVENVGLKTTRLRSLSGEQLVISNSDLLKSRIRNYGRMYERRVVFNIGVTYQTTREQLIKIPKIITDAVKQQDKTRFDRSHFKEYGNFSLNFESVYYVKGPDYNAYMDIQQAINLYIHEMFEQEGIEFAYPTQTVFMQQTE